MNATAFVTGTAIIKDPVGLHARPAVKLTKLAKTFSATIEIRPERLDKWVNAKSPNAVMKLKAANGEALHIRACGDDAQSGVEALINLVDKDFNG